MVPEPVRVDERGYLPEALEAALRRPLAAVISTPRAQNPTGAAVDEERARDLRLPLPPSPPRAAAAPRPARQGPAPRR
jgi:hypothetical protein